MGYDVYVGRDSAGFNYTYNCAPMFNRAIPGGIYALDGLTGKKALALLEDGIAAMRAAPIEYKALNPPNGWGRYESAIEFLEEICGACNVSRRAKIRVT